MRVSNALKGVRQEPMESVIRFAPAPLPGQLAFDFNTEPDEKVDDNKLQVEGWMIAHR